MFESQVTWLYVGSALKGAFMHVVMISRSYHTAAYPTNTVVLAIFLCSYGSIRVLVMDDIQKMWIFHHSPLDFSEAIHFAFVLEPL